jgi:serine/threonine protein kinase
MSDSRNSATRPAPSYEDDPLAPPPDEPRFRQPAVAGELGRIAGYRVQKVLGKGGMGAVYLALDESLNRRVALKVMLPRFAVDAHSSERFRREARAAAAVKHENVVTVYQVGEDCGVPFIAMEYLSGYPLDEYLQRKGRLNVAQALRVGAEAAAGLAAAHAVGLVHRDIKPANLWLEAPHGRIKILDFGLARPVEVSSQAGGLTRTGVVLGTPAYMSPEQAAGDPLDHRTDLFSLGVVLYQLVTGRRPFERSSPLAGIIALATDAPQSPRALNPDVSEAFDALILKLLEKDPAKRPQNGTDVATALAAIRRGAGTSEPRDLTVAPVAAQPQVVYVPIHVTAYEPAASAFENLADPSAAPTPAPPRERTERDSRDARPARAPHAPRGGVPAWAYALAAVCGAALLAAGAYFALKGPKDAAKAPEPPESKPPEPKPKPKPPTETARAVAQWVLDNGGVVYLDSTKTVTAPAKLPPGDLTVTGIQFHTYTYRFSDDDVSRLRALSDLAILSLAAPTDLTETGLARLAALPRAADLTSVHLHLPEAAAPGVRHLAQCKGLKYLSIVNPPLSGRVEFVRELPVLSQLNFTNCKLTDADLKPLADLKLYTLAVQNNPGITGAAMEHIVAMPDVEQLNLGGTGIPPDDLAKLANVPRLSVLALPDMNLKDDDLAFLSKLPNLLTLNLAGNPITERTLDHIGGATKLSQFVAHNTTLTDAALVRLATRDGLKQVFVNNSCVTADGVKTFRAARPNCKVDFE